MKELTDIRKELDGIDGRLLSLLIDRQELVEQVIAYKNKHGLPIRDLAREEEILNNKINLAQDKLDPDFVKDIFRRIIEESCRLQESLKK